LGAAKTFGQNDRIIIDEVHTIFSESRFRSSFQVYEWLPSLGVPIIALSGSLPLFVLPTLSPLSLKLCLSQKSDMSDCHIIHCENIVGVFPEGFKITVEMRIEHTTKGQCSSQDAIHVYTDVKENTMTIYKNLCKTFRCWLVTAESTQQDQEDSRGVV
jgi:hypothetical protein